MTERALYKTVIYKYEYHFRAVFYKALSTSIKNTEVNSCSWVNISLERCSALSTFAKKRLAIQTKKYGENHKKELCIICFPGAIRMQFNDWNLTIALMNIALSFKFKFWWFVICYLFRLWKRSRLYFLSVFVWEICDTHNFVLGAMNKHEKHTIK